MKRALWSAVLSVMAGFCIYPDAAFGAPMRCDIVESSGAGGVVEVNTDESPAPVWWPFQIKLQARWRPPPALPSPQLVVGYFGATLTDMGNDPSGGHIRFRISPPRLPDDTVVILSLPHGEAITFRGADLGYGLDYGSDDETRPVMDIGFTSEHPDWANIRSALTERGWLRVKLVRHSKTVVEADFDLSNREAREALLAEARRKVAMADPRVCTNAPRPVERMSSANAELLLHN